MGESGNREGQGKFNGKLVVVSERTGRDDAKCVVKKKGVLTEERRVEKEKQRERKRERFRSVEVCL